ncbi:hypothetical protein OSB04_014449 [Centaurea solstitialis]|uniref:Myb/SANT-like domain-containing protein n=1 Tax=Centaurea solstitialis TaxID=347529 RepID=A0AA38SYQ2_9ASTR|nr:hypothetical protein OSB04_014449 [Centaurea solstitialis]
MSVKNDDGVPISWTDENTILFCDVCINFITKNGRAQSFRWRDIQEQFMEKLGTKCQQKSMKNKYDAMKKDWRLWKYLKRGETGLGWNSTTGKLECSNEWWENKLKEKPEAKKFRFKGLSPLLEERWDHLFGDAVATGESCVAPSLTPEFVDQSVSQVEEIENREGGIQDKDGTSDAYNGCSQYSKILEGLDYQEASFWEGFIEDVRGTIAPNSNLPNTIAPKSNPLKTSDQNPTKGVKRKRRESGGSAFLRQHLKKADERHSEIMDLFKQGTNSKNDEVSIDHIMEIMNRMATMSDFEIGGPTWCHAMLMFRDPTTREIFFKMPSDDARLSWLEFARTRNTI